MPARIILRKRKFDSITTDVRDRLHWLPVLQRIEYKVCALIYKCLHQAAPTYIPVSESVNRGHLRSDARGDLVVPRSRTTRYGQRSFAVAGATLWNSLPLSVRDPSLTLVISVWWSSVVVSTLVSINEVNLRRTRLVLRWVTLSGSIPGAGHLFQYVTNQPPKANSAFHPSGVGK